VNEKCKRGKFLGRKRGKRVSEAGTSRSDSDYARTRIVPDARRKCLVYNGDVATGTRPNAIKTLLNSCKYRMPVNRDVVFPARALAVRKLQLPVSAVPEKKLSEFGSTRAKAEARPGQLAGLQPPSGHRDVSAILPQPPPITFRAVATPSYTGVRTNVIVFHTSSPARNQCFILGD
jgi:hypothetical protein